MLASSNYDDQVAAADIFNIVGRLDLSMPQFLHVVERWPKQAKIWMTMGEWELNSNQPQSAPLALAYLQKAIDLNYRTAEAYSFLAAAYLKLGEIDQAEQAAWESLSINSERADARQLLDTINKAKQHKQ